MKRLLAALLSAVIVCAVVEAILLRRARQTVADLEAKINELRSSHIQVVRDLATARKELQNSDVTLARADDLLKELSAISAGRDSKMESEVHAWLDRVRRLKDLAKRMPERTIPEMRFLEERDWLDAAKANIDTDDEARQALSSLRGTAKGRFAPALRSALRKYEEANGSEPPTAIMQLSPYFDSPIEEAILQRYTVPPPVPGQPGWARKVIVETSRVDDDYDTKMTIQEGGGTGFESTSQLQDAMRQADVDYARANGGKFPSDQMQLVPYLPQAMVEKFTKLMDESRKRGFK